MTVSLDLEEQRTSRAPAVVAR